MSCTEALQQRLAEGPEKPDPTSEEKRDPRFQQGYALGWHHGLEDAIEISEEVEE